LRPSFRKPVQHQGDIRILIDIVPTEPGGQSGDVANGSRYSPLNILFAYTLSHQRPQSRVNMLSKCTLHYGPDRMNRPTRTVVILVGQYITQPAIRQAIITASSTARRIFPQAFHLTENIIGPFNAHLV